MQSTVNSPEIGAIRDMFFKRATADAFNNMVIDLEGQTHFVEKVNAKVVKELLPDFIDTQRKAGKHMIVLKLSPQHSRIARYALDSHFSPHHANPKTVWLTLCLDGSQGHKCSYPAYKTISVGVTGVVFNQDLTKFLAVKEKFGPYRDWKAPTGTVDYEKETPIHAVVRELQEETKVEVKAEDAVLVADGWTPILRDAPDVNMVYAFRIDEKQHTLEAQQDEIAKVKWLSVEEFAELPVTLVHDKPFVIKKVVAAALDAMKSGTGWKAHYLAWASGKDIIFYAAKH